MGVMSKWISVKDKLPENDNLIVVFYQGDYVIAYYHPSAKAFDSFDYGWLEDEGVTHWFPLPEKDPVKGENNGSI